MKKFILLLFLAGAAATGNAITPEKFFHKYKDHGIYSQSINGTEADKRSDSTYISGTQVLSNENFATEKEAARFRKDLKRLRFKEYTLLTDVKDGEDQIQVYGKTKKNGAYCSEIVTIVKQEDQVILMRATGRISPNLKDAPHIR